MVKAGAIREKGRNKGGEKLDNKAEICKLLTDILRKTKGHYDVVKIEYRPERSLAYIHYASGTQVPVYADGTDIDMAIRILERAAEKEHLNRPGKVKCSKKYSFTL